MNAAISSQLDRLQKIGLGVGGLGLVLCGVGVALNRQQFFPSYLIGFTFWLGLALGCLGVAMIPII